MSGATGRGELAWCGAGLGGLTVWALASAARAGWLRALLDVYPRSMWDRVTWVLVPVLLLLPSIIQGAAVAALAPGRPMAVGRAVMGSLGGSLLVLAGAGVAAVVTARRVPGLAAGAGGGLPVLLVLGCAVVLVAGCVAAAAEAVGSPRMRRAALAVAVAIVAIVWAAGRAWVISAAAVLDRAEVAAFFVAIAAGGGVGSAWAIRACDR